MILPNLLSTPSSGAAQRDSGRGFAQPAQIRSEPMNSQQMGNYLKQVGQVNDQINSGLSSSQQRNINTARSMNVDAATLQAISQTRQMPSVNYYSKLLLQQQNAQQKGNNQGVLGQNQVNLPPQQENNVGQPFPSQLKAQPRYQYTKEQIAQNPNLANVTGFSGQDTNTGMASLPVARVNGVQAPRNYGAPQYATEGTGQPQFKTEKDVLDYYTKPNTTIPVASAESTGGDPFADIRALLR